jgi:hypothetical protein
MNSKRHSFGVFLLTVFIVYNCVGWAGDVIYIIRKTLDERVADLERRCDEYDRLLRIQLQPTTTVVNPRNMGRYMIQLQDDTTIIAVTFEREEKHYIIHLENGKRIRSEHRQVRKIEYISFNSGGNR